MDAYKTICTIVVLIAVVVGLIHFKGDNPEQTPPPKVENYPWEFIYRRVLSSSKPGGLIQEFLYYDKENKICVRYLTNWYIESGKFEEVDCPQTPVVEYK